MKRVALAILLLTAVAAAVFLALNRPGAEASPDVTITVNSTDDTNSRDGVLTLREAMLLATVGLAVGTLDAGECNQVSTGSWSIFMCLSSVPIGTGTAESIVFDPGVFNPDTITLGSQLPTLSTGGDSIDGSGAGVIVDGMGVGFDCFTITSDSNTIKGLEIYNCYNAVSILSSAQNNTIGGSSQGERNVISGNDEFGVIITGSGTDDNVVKGNYVGTNASGTAALPNEDGGVVIAVGAQSNIVGGSTASERNVISGNGASGVRIDDHGTDGNVVKGNRIGTDASGVGAIPNEEGVWISGGADNNTVQSNLISGNAKGVLISGSGTDENVLKGNYIGTDASGATAVRNTFGVWIGEGAQNNTVGGSTAGERNVISGNEIGLIISDNGTNGNVVKGNYIGTNASGTAPIPNLGPGVGIQVGAQNNTVGGSSPGEGNVISGNNDGVRIVSSATSGNVVKGNYIGINASGTAAISNRSKGVYLGAPNNTVGGSNPGEGNVISGNDSDGLYVAGSDAQGNVIKGNYIGTDASGTAAVPNGTHGVLIWDGQNNTVGGSTTDEGNTIAFNSGDGVEVRDATATGNTIRGNSIHSNGDKGIENIDGGNAELTPPTITGFGSVTGTACANCTIDVYSDDENEGEVYEGSTTAGGSGDWSFSGSPQGPKVAATNTDSDGNTSEFSDPVAVPEPTPSPSPSPTATPTGTPPVGPTRSVDWSPGWHNATWSGASTPEEAFACAAGNYAAAYRLVAGGWQRYFPDRPDISNMSDFEQYDPFLILITGDVTCEMPVAGSLGTERTLDWGVGWQNDGWTGADDSAPEDVFDCAEGSYAAAYRLVGGGWERYFPDRPEICNMGPLDGYGTFLILVTAPVGCSMAIAP